MFKSPLILFLAGMLITIFGAWAKILHLSFADMALTAGMLLQGVGVAYSIYILIRTK
jgi:hypothetical protein